MNFIFGLLLVALGMLAGREFLSSKSAFIKKTVDKIYPYAEIIGMISLLFGFIWVLIALAALQYIDSHPLAILGALVSSLLTELLGLIFALPMLHKFMNEPTPGFLLKADRLSAKLVPYQSHLGLLALVLGILTLLP